jgi:hypothetical protein
MDIEFRLASLNSIPKQPLSSTVRTVPTANTGALYLGNIASRAFAPVLNNPFGPWRLEFRSFLISLARPLPAGQGQGKISSSICTPELACAALVSFAFNPKPFPIDH